MRKIYILLTICLVAFNASSQMISSNLVLYIPINNSFADSGTYKLPVKSFYNSYVPDHLGNINSALAIKGQLFIKDTSLFRLKNFSIAVWFYFDTIPNDTVTLISKSVGTSKSCTFIISCTKNKILCKTGTDTGYTDSLSYSLIFERQRWFHIAFTVDSVAREKRLYVNATMVDSSRRAVKTKWDNHPLVFGASYINSAFQDHISGGIDELRIYEDRVLSQDEIFKVMTFNDQIQAFSKYKSRYDPMVLICGGGFKNNQVSFKVYPNVISKSSGSFVYIEFDSEEQSNHKFIQIISESGVVMAEIPVTAQKMEIPVNNLSGMNFIQILNQNKTAANNTSERILVVE